MENSGENQPEELIGLHAVESMREKNVVWNFNEKEFYDFMENETPFELEGWRWMNNSKTIIIHSEHRTDEHFIAQRQLRGGEYAYSNDKMWHSLDDFKNAMRRKGWTK